MALTDEEVIKEAQERGKLRIQKWVSEDCCSTEEFVELTQMSEATLHEFNAEGLYFGIEHGGRWYWPKFQTTRPPKFFKTILGYLRNQGCSPWEIFMFWLFCEDDSISNIEKLREGRWREVLRDASTLYGHGR